MQELIESIEKWFAQGKQVALAMVVKVKDSAPRGLGAKMAVSSTGEMEGSVSAGCVEGAVVQEALQVMKTGKPVLVKYGISDEQAFSVGLSCGGTIEVFIRPFLAAELAITKPYLESGRFFAQGVLLDGSEAGRTVTVFPEEDLLAKLEMPEFTLPEDVTLSGLFHDQLNNQLELRRGGDVQTLFFNIYPLPSRLIAVGGVHTAISLLRMAKAFHFHTILVDPRKAFANRERFPDVDELLAEWPQEVLPRLNLDEGCYFVTLSHDDKIDIPAAEFACNSNARYIGMLASRKNAARRREILLTDGLSEEQVARIHSPVGLNIGARGPEEIALSILTEMVSARNGVSSQ
jgi:xanthine dehydrogenase accessory factor